MKAFSLKYTPSMESAFVRLTLHESSSNCIICNEKFVSLFQRCLKKLLLDACLKNAEQEFKWNAAWLRTVCECQCYSAFHASFLQHHFASIQIC